MSPSNSDVESRVQVALAVGRYLTAVERFESASKEFETACAEMRGRLATPTRFVTKVDFRYFLVTSDHERNFEVEELDLI